QFQPLVRSNGINYIGSLKGLTSNYDYYSEVYTTNPSTGSAWTIAQVDALEAGMKSYSSKYGGRIAQVYAVVDYSTLNTCFDTDGGYALTIFGEVSGYLNQSYYSYSDYCTSNTTIVEYYCSGGYSYSWGSSCANGMTSICSNGACI
ncbi:MAG: hypothetical protein U1E54_05160, partial [Candidatus Levybacteria bacterium]|nr:hypothetical protein [Candidatus Levybacteria bacterium]